MIAKELVDGAPLWADIAVTDEDASKRLKKLFHQKNLEINIVRRGIRNIELYGALKNVVAMIIGYYEGKWYGASTLWLYMCKLFGEIKGIVKMLWGEDDIDFEDFSLWGDIIASCFWDSRNKYFWKLIGSGKTAEEALAILIQEKKRAEWFETLKGLKRLLIKKKEGFELTQQMIKIALKEEKITKKKTIWTK